MDIQLALFGNSTPAFSLTLELDRIAATCACGLSRIGIQVFLQRTSLWDQQLNGRYPIILALHGALYSETSYDMPAATMLPPEELPLTLPGRDTQQLVNFRFPMPEHFVQFLEEERATKQGASDMRVGLKLWGTVALQNASLHPGQIEVMGWEGLRGGTGPSTVRIPRSDWLDRFLPGLGYGRRVLIELPLTRIPPVPEQYKQAAAALDAARNAFEHEDYRAVLKYGREVLEYLGNLVADGKLTTFCGEKLKPVVGETKANAIDRGLNALRDIVNASSHANAFTADRAIAAYIIESLAIQLRYISAVVSV
jgi:hypothetical protein